MQARRHGQHWTKSRASDLRMACLDERHAEVSALLHIFADADPVVVQRSVVAVSSLGELSRCADVSALTAPIAPPPASVADYALSSLADAHSALREFDIAIGYAEEGLSIAEAHEVEISQRAHMRFVTAKALGAARRSPERARQLARQARADFESSERPAAQELAAIEAWLKTH